MRSAQDKYTKLEQWARSRWSSAQERVFAWSAEVCLLYPALCAMSAQATHQACLQYVWEVAGMLTRHIQLASQIRSVTV